MRVIKRENDIHICSRTYCIRLLNRGPYVILVYAKYVILALLLLQMCIRLFCTVTAEYLSSLIRMYFSYTPDKAFRDFHQC